MYEESLTVTGDVSMMVELFIAPASYLQYSLGNEAFKYNEAIHKEDMALLRVFMFPPGATTAKTTTTNR